MLKNSWDHVVSNYSCLPCHPSHLRFRVRSQFSAIHVTGIPETFFAVGPLLQSASPCPSARVIAYHMPVGCDRWTRHLRDTDSVTLQAFGNRRSFWWTGEIHYCYRHSDVVQSSSFACFWPLRRRTTRHSWGLQWCTT